MSISDVIYKSIRACPLKEVNGRVDNYTEEDDI